MKKYGASGYQQLATAVSTVTAGLPVLLHATNTVAALMAANEEDYPFIEFRVQVNSGNSGSNTISIYARCTDGVDTAPAPDSTFKETLVAVIPTDGSNSFFYEKQALNIDKNATFYIESSDAATINVDVGIRMWDWDAPA